MLGHARCMPHATVGNNDALCCSIDMVLAGAEGVVENGGVINKLGTYQIAVCARAHNKPVYIAAESYKVCCGCFSPSSWICCACTQRSRLTGTAFAVRPFVPSDTAGLGGRTKARRLFAACTQPHGYRQPVARLHAAKVRDSVAHGPWGAGTRCRQ